MRKGDAVNRWLGRCGLCKGELRLGAARVDMVLLELIANPRPKGLNLHQLECVECGQGYLVTRSPADRDDYAVQALEVM